MNPNSMIQPEDEDVPNSQDAYNKYVAPEFCRLVMEGKWEEVIKKYKEHVYFHKIRIRGRGTALHVAVSNANEESVKSLVDAIVKHNDQSGFEITTERGDTPLHLAAYRGFKSMCECIIGENGERKDLIKVNNEKGETPLFCAVLARHKRTFLYLHQFFKNDIGIAINKEGDTILHVAIHREMFGMANIIMHLYPSFASRKDKYGVLPLEDLATRTSAFKSGNKLSWWEQILYYCVVVKVKDAKTSVEDVEYKEKSFKKKHIAEKGDQSQISIPVDELLCNVSEKSFKKKHIAEKGDQSQISIPVDELLRNVSGIKSVKKKQMYAAKLLKAFMENSYETYMCGELYNTSTQEIKENNGNDPAYLIAAKHGIIEIMRALESKLSSVSHETNANRENALHLAVKNRQPHVVEWLRESLAVEIFYSLSLEVDINENTILHLAACQTTDNEDTAWKISGAGMQLMWDIKWYKYIKGLVPDQFHYRSNNDKKTPGEIFKEEHKVLLEESIKWLKETTESCAVVAALVAGVSFATSGSVPGGNQQTGYPTFQKQPAFKVFSVCSLIGLYYSVMSLFSFLSILVCRKHIEDFSRKLPVMLILVLTSLFGAIVAMFMSFIAGHYFVLFADKYNKSNFYLYLAVCCPVTFYAVGQYFPLYIDLLKVILQKVPPRSIKSVQL